jgi:phage-related protein
MVRKGMSTTQNSGSTLASVATGILNALAAVLQAVVDFIAQNATVIATVIFVGGLIYLLLRYGRSIFSGIFDWLRGIF